MFRGEHNESGISHEVSDIFFFAKISLGASLPRYIVEVGTRLLHAKPACGLGPRGLPSLALGCDGYDKSTVGCGQDSTFPTHHNA